MSNATDDSGSEIVAGAFRTDASLPAQLVGNLLAIGLFVRSVCHVTAALLGGHEPQLAAYDVSLVSPVEDLRGRFSADLSARLLSLAVGVVLWAAVAPLSMSTSLTGGAELAVRAYVAANIAAAAADPLFFVLGRR